MPLLGACAIFAIVVLLSMLRALRQFRCYDALPPNEAQAPWQWPSVAVIVPARNEAHNIGRCLRGLRRQHYPEGQLQIIVVDDDSSDDTAAVVADEAAPDDRIQLIALAALPAGWSGKPHACWCGARASAADWLCFIDADTSAEPDLLHSAIATAQRRNLDMLSLEPFQELTGWLDRLVIPLGFLALAVTQDLARVAAPGEDAAATANGQFILIRAQSYFALGGHAAVRSEICEDAALARRVKASGRRMALLGAESLIRTRMYRNARELWEGLSKNLTDTYGGPIRTLSIAMAAFLVGWSALILPILSAASAASSPSAAAIAALTLASTAALAVFAMQLALVRHFRIPFWYGLLLPLNATAGLAIAGNAVLVRLRRRVAWKGRIYAAPARRPHRKRHLRRGVAGGERSSRARGRSHSL